jgi:hypothetical protein
MFVGGRFPVGEVGMLDAQFQELSEGRLGSRNLALERRGRRSGSFIGERGGTRTLDPMIKSHVLYRLSYALT